MLTIRAEQMAIFQANAQCSFQTRLCQYLRRRLPEATSQFDNEHLQKVVQNHVAAANQYGVVTQAAVAQFVCLAFLPGPLFYENKYLKKFLADVSITAERRMEYLVEQFSNTFNKLKRNSNEY